MAATQSEMILIMGDVYIPNRIDQIPEEIKKVLMDNKTDVSQQHY